MKLLNGQKPALVGAILSSALVATTMFSAMPANAAETATGTGAAQSDGAQGRAAWGYYTKMISKSSTGSYVGTEKLASCGSRTAAMDCSLTKGKAATRSIGLDLGATRKWAAGQLKISASGTQSVSVTCRKQKVAKGKQLVAYPVGVRYKDKIEKHMTGAGKDYVTGTSGWLYAFNPGSARVSCDIRNL